MECYDLAELLQAVIFYEGNRTPESKIRLMRAKQHCIVHYDIEKVRHTVRQAYATMYGH